MTTRARNPLFPLTAATLLFAAVCLAFAVLLTGYHFRYCWNPHSYERQIGFDYPKPFVQRVLVVVVAKMLVQLLHVHPKIVFVSLDILAFWLAGLLYAVYLAFYFPRRTCLLLAPLLYLIIPWVLIMPMWESFWYPYDPYALVFTLALLILLAKQSYGGFTVVFAVATCNRETTFFMTFYLILAAWRTLPFRTLSAWVTAQFLIWVGVKFCLGWCFQAHSGATLFQHQYWSNVRFMFDMTYEQRLGYSFELLVRLAFIPGQFAFIWILPVLGWRYLQHFLRAGLITLIIFILMMSYVANLYESRIFLETIPWVLTPALVVLVRWLGDSLHGSDCADHAPTGAFA